MKRAPNLATQDNTLINKGRGLRINQDNKKDNNTNTHKAPSKEKKGKENEKDCFDFDGCAHPDGGKC